MTEPSDADGLHKLGNELVAGGDHAGAARAFERALELDPSRPTTLNNLANLLRERGDLEAAAALYRRAVDLGGKSAALLSNFAKTALALGRADEALRLAEAATAAAPEREAGPLLHARALAALGDVAGAREVLLRATARSAHSGALFNELGLVLARLGAGRDSLAALETAASLLPTDAAVLANLGDARRRALDLDGALSALTRALEIAPTSADALESLAALQITLGACDEAAATAERAAAQLQGTRALDLGSMRLFALAHSDRLAPSALFEEHRAWGEAATRLYDEPGSSRSAGPREERTARAEPGEREQRGSRRPRVVYLSPDLRDHVVARFLGPILAAHDPERVEVVLATTAVVKDATTEALRAGRELLDLAGMPRQSARERLLSAQPDVIVELAGHSGDPVLQLLTPRLAPLQVTYLGFPGTTGLSSIDLRITDVACDPAGSELDFSERLARLPRPPWVYLPGDIPDVTPRHGRASPTFGCFNRATKLTPTTLELFARVLVALPEARLVLRPRVFGSATATKRLLAPFAEAGCAGRVELRADAPSFQDALRGYRDLDVALDTFPYHGTTTTCDALLMGVPVVSLMGSTPAARVSRSLLGAVGLDDLATEDASAFVEAAARLALDTGRLDTLRAELRERVLRGPLGDARGLARALEDVYLGAARRPPGAPEG